VDEPVSHASNLTPRDIAVRGFQMGTELRDCLANDLEISDHCILRHIVRQKIGFGLAGNEPLYLPNRFQDVLQVVTVSEGRAHSDLAS
jgi:hypothetical protein